jgi:hypothetical protein
MLDIDMLNKDKSAGILIDTLFSADNVGQSHADFAIFALKYQL